MLVLGIGGFMHDYNCCLVDVDARRVAMREAERLSRRKHHVITEGDDLLAPIRACCEDLGRRVKDIDVVVFGHTDPFACKDELRRLLKGAEFVEVDHHLCHAAAAFYASPFEGAAVVSVDGFGDGSSALIARGSGTRIDEVERVGDGDSIGLEYLRATVHIGLGGHGAEGKTQGLAAYGEPTLFEDYMNEIEVTPAGGLRLSAKLRSEDSRLAEEGGYLNTQLLTNDFLNQYSPRRIAPEPLTDVYKNLAASIQKVLEHVVMEMARTAKRRTGEQDLVLSGGVALNSSMNGALLASGEFRRIFPVPMASDRGIGVGAALYHVHHTLGVPRFFRLDHVFFGGEYTDSQIIKAAKRAKLRWSTTGDIAGAAAEALAQSRIVGWFQGRSELGARALGHRSILADPRRAEMKDFVNARVKHREWFRPFAPATLVETAADYFVFPNHQAADLSFMTFTVPATPRAAERAPAVVHVDGTARIQTVYPERDGLYAEIIARFGELTGVPVILNTSFNDKDEPIVETPEDAVATFLKTDMDVLCAGNVVITKA